MSEAATPAAAAPAAAPAATPAKPDEGKLTVTLTQEEHEQLKRDAARAASAQSRADRLQGLLGRQGGHFNATPPVKPPEVSKEDREAQAVEEDRKAERGLVAVAIDPKYRELLDSDTTLRNLFTQNPLGVLPVLAPEALDAEDAIALVREKLDERLASLKRVTPTANPAPAVETPKTPPSPPVGGINANDKAVDEEYEAAKKLPNTQQAIAGMVKVGLKNLGKGGKS